MPRLSKKQRNQRDESVRKSLPAGLEFVQTLCGHKGVVYSVSFSPQGGTLASGSYDRTVKLWDSTSGELLRTLEGHKGYVNSVSFSPQGGTLASGGDDGTVKLWDSTSGELLRTLEGHQGLVNSVSFSPQGGLLASGSGDRTVKLWDCSSGQLLRTLEGHKNWVNSVSFSPQGGLLASGSLDETVKLWDCSSGQLLRTLEGHQGLVYSVSFSPQGGLLASGSDDNTVKLWDSSSGHLLRTLEGHTGIVESVSFSSDGRLLGTKSDDGTVRFWSTSTWSCVLRLEVPADTQWWTASGLSFHPKEPLFAVVSRSPVATSDRKRMRTSEARYIHIYRYVPDLLLGQVPERSTQYVSAKVVLVGDSGVGKTGLGWRLAHGQFKEHSSTHGQQFWLLKQLSKQRSDGAQCEGILWDLAGQPDYRLTHALFLDDADLALILFDATHNEDPLKGVEFWLRQLNVTRSPQAPLPPAGKGSPQPICPALLVAARSDRGTPRLTQDELKSFCKQRGITAYLRTSASSGEGLDKLLRQIQRSIPWNDKSATITTDTFKRTKDYVLALKENHRRRQVILTPAELRERLEKSARRWKFTDDEMLTAVGHLANHGYVVRLKTSAGDPRILLAPELLNNLAASFVLEARRNEKGLGSLDEKQLLAGHYKFPEIARLTHAERDVLLDSAAVLFLEHNVCFRETDPLNGHVYLVFPELINLKKPQIEETTPLEETVAYTVSGAVENVYASLVVLLGYTETFTRTNQWQNHARYEVGKGLVCGFRVEAERPGELDFVLYFGADTDAPIRTLFQGLFESFLARRNLTVRRLEPVLCPKGHPILRAVIRERTAAGAHSAFCSECGRKTSIPKDHTPIHLTKHQAAEVEANRLAADRRSRFEQVLFRLKSHVTDTRIKTPECFISYAWGNAKHEHWVEHSLATDLQKAGIKVVLDRWENAQPGASIPRFIERITDCNYVIVVGTRRYRSKDKNKGRKRGTVLAAEGDLIRVRMTGTEAQKASVVPVLLEGTEESSFPSLLHRRVRTDFRKSGTYFATALDLILKLYKIAPTNPLTKELCSSLQDPKSL